MSDSPCSFPDDDGPCFTHGTVMCHLAPITSGANVIEEEL